jgi:hypothetical protein
MAVCSVRESKWQAHLFKQTREQQSFSTVPLLCESPLEERFLECYDSSSYVYYCLSVKGTLYACDFRCNYNFLGGGYQLRKLCVLEGVEAEVG